MVKRARRRLRSRVMTRSTMAIASIVFLLGLALGVDLARRLGQARTDLRAAHTEIGRALSLVLERPDSAPFPTEAEYRASLTAIESANSSIISAQSHLGYVLVGVNALGWLPRWGDQISASDDLLALAQRVSEDTSTTLRAVEPLFSDDQPQAALNTILTQNGDDLVASLSRLSSERAEVQRLAAISWSGPWAPIMRLTHRLNEAQPKVASVASAVKAARTAYPMLMGFDTPQRYLILGQNSQEIRPTGGFIGTIGLVTIEAGHLTESQYSKVENWEEVGPPFSVDPPFGFRHFYGGIWWRTRDMNWYADFPRSANAVMESIAHAPGTQADGVIAINNGFVTRMLAIFGPLTLDEFPEPVTAESWTSQVEVGIKASGQAGVRDARRFHLEPILKALLHRLENTPRAQVPQVAFALRESVATRELQVFSRNQIVQSFVTQVGAHGGLPGHDGSEDVVAVVDTNLSETKVGPAIRREVLYVARADGNTDLIVTWTNTASTVDRQRNPRIDGGGVIYKPNTGYRKVPNVFGNYFRVYIPPDADVLEVIGSDDPPLFDSEPGFLVVSGFITVPDGESRTLIVAYRPTIHGSPTAVTLWHQGGVGGTLRVVANTAVGAGTMQQKLYEGPFTRDVRAKIR